MVCVLCGVCTVCVHAVCVHAVCVHAVCVHAVCVHAVCVHAVCVHAVCPGCVFQLSVLVCVLSLHVYFPEFLIEKTRYGKLLSLPFILLQGTMRSSKAWQEEQSPEYSGETSPS